MILVEVTQILQEFFNISFDRSAILYSLKNVLYIARVQLVIYKLNCVISKIDTRDVQLGYGVAINESVFGKKWIFASKDCDSSGVRVYTLAPQGGEPFLYLRGAVDEIEQLARSWVVIKHYKYMVVTTSERLGAL